MDRKEHWESIYRTKNGTQVSWYQPVPQISLDLIKELDLNKDARIIDIGGGDSRLVDFLTDQGFTDVSVLDISGKALSQARERLGTKGEKVTWIEEDATAFKPDRKFDLWHDRATFHFLNSEEEQARYLKKLRASINPGGNVILGTFSERGPTRCSGIEITQYSTQELEQLLGADFQDVACRNSVHQTPSGSLQEFSFCSFRKFFSAKKNR